MRRILFASLVLFGGVAAAQSAQPTARGQLPAGWSKLGLSAEQKANIYKVQTSHRTKIEQLAVEIERLKTEQIKQCLEVLSPEQKALLATQGKAKGKGKVLKQPSSPALTAARSKAAAQVKQQLMRRKGG